MPTLETSAAPTLFLEQIRKPEICQAIEDIFSACGFTLEDSVKSHIGHIRGTHTKQVLAGGEVVELRIPPSFAALASYQKLVLPAQTARVQIEHSSIGEMLKTIDAEERESAVMRTVGEVIDVEPEADPDDVDPFEDEESDEEGEDDE